MSAGSTTQKKQTPKTAIVIGAGTGGIAIAARLAKAGLAVTVLEKNSFTGGRCSLFTTEAGFRFDQGPSLLLLPGLFHEAFADLNTTLKDEGVELLQCTPNYDIWFADGEVFRSSTDTAAMKREIERFEGPDGFQRYLTWMAEAHGHYETSLRQILHRNFTSVAQMAGPRFVAAGIGLHPLESIWSRAGRYFWTDRLRRVFTFATMYMGMSPFDAPSTYSLLQYTELAEGIWYPRGGFHKVLEALERVGRGLGVKYRLNAPVTRILARSDGARATGVELAGGETLEADLVVVNADLVYAYSNLFPQQGAVGEKTARYAKDLQKRDASCSSISFYWSFSKKLPQLGTHNIFLADEYKASFDVIFQDKSLPDNPSFYINVPSRIDPSAAPAGCDAVIALVPVGHLTSAPESAPQDWPALVAKARAAVLAIVQARTRCEALAPLITHEIVNTPNTWRDKFNLDRGAILGLSHNFLNVLAFRPRTRAEGLAGAYFVGASTHPGTGVPIVLAGAKITAEQILKDHGMAIPWERAAAAAGGRGTSSPSGVVAGEGGSRRRVRVSSLDQIRPPLWVSDMNLLLGGIIGALVLLLLLVAGPSSLPASFLGDW
ncbi:hypothetical protein B0T26DRAFT_751063 [Lasiosphaeria miniovina]|uniref:Phytoene desaturase n=1 Tax=Lasiosphaeria miniovina TaxID=1954250 RepID=A0AA40AJA8_9PEZI|nr:uncharacterized protein B0T26DRAFT_751063 [Lasiosphaeria miniovina]KAK0716921.1 hypothetical protein B0T26DRAFT_751063 [Lasiosphaeria miniovina]